MSMTHIQRITATGSQSVLDFQNIPQGYTDLVLLVSARHPTTTSNAEHYITINGLAGNGTLTDTLFLRGNALGSAISYSVNNSGALFQVNFQNSASAANTFSSFSMYMQNYSNNAINKTFSIDSIQETNSTETFQILASGVIRQTSPITSLQYNVGGAGGNWVAGTMASLYGITRTPESLVFDFLGGVEGFTSNAATLSASGGILTVSATGGDPFFTSPGPMNVAGSSARYIKLRWRRSVVAQSGSWAGQIFYETAGHGYSESFTYFAPQPIWKDGYIETVIDMNLSSSPSDYLNNLIRSWRFDLTHGPDGADYLIDKIEFSDTP